MQSDDNLEGCFSTNKKEKGTLKLTRLQYTGQKPKQPDSFIYKYSLIILSLVLLHNTETLKK